MNSPHLTARQPFHPTGGDKPTVSENTQTNFEMAQSDREGHMKQPMPGYRSHHSPGWGTNEVSKQVSPVAETE